MSNLGGYIDLLKIKNACLINVKGKTTTKRCIAIPLEELYEGEKSVRLNFTGFELREVSKYGDTHMIKPSIAKEKFEAMSQEEQYAIPILGNMKPIAKQEPKKQEINTDVDAREGFGGDVSDDLPF